MKWLSMGPLRGRSKGWVVAGLLVLVALVWGLTRPATPSGPASSPATIRPALTVTAIQTEESAWPHVLSANGNIMAWQEVVISPELANLRLAEVRAQVGDVVKRGAVLAQIDATTVTSELAEARASVAELEAAKAEAQANARRAQALQDKGFYSPQTGTQYRTGEQAAEARLAAAQARLQAAEWRLARTRITAPDDGIVSARQATVGALTQPGQPLFQLIRGGRLEWRAEVASADLARITPGTPAELIDPQGNAVTGRVRTVAPSVDTNTRNGLVFVDLPASTALKAGMFARGQFRLGEQPARHLPQAAVVQREGFAYVFRIESGEGEVRRVQQTKINLGRRQGDRVELLDGLPPGAEVVANGAAFLADGDWVRVVPAGSAP